MAMLIILMCVGRYWLWYILIIITYHFFSLVTSNGDPTLANLPL
jgi:hypothetical protein